MDIETLHQKFVEYGANAREWQRKCALLLPEIVKYRVWEKRGFSGIYEYAARMAGFSRFQVDDALRILTKISDKPSLMKVVEQKGLNAVRPVATIATVETAEYWARRAKDLAKNELEVFVRDVRRAEARGEAVGNIMSEPWRELGQKPGELEEVEAGRLVLLSVGNVGKVPPELEEVEAGRLVSPRHDEAVFKLKKLELNLRLETAERLENLNHGGWEELMAKLLEAYERNLAMNKPKKVVTSSRHIPKAIVGYVEKRSGGKCEFPACKKTYDHLHHVDRFASVKEHDPDKIVALCREHHGLAHKGFIGGEDDLRRAGKILKKPDYANLNRFIDEKVQFYRRG